MAALSFHLSFRTSQLVLLPRRYSVEVHLQGLLTSHSCCTFADGIGDRCGMPSIRIHDSLKSDNKLSYEYSQPGLYGQVCCQYEIIRSRTRNPRILSSLSQPTSGMWINRPATEGDTAISQPSLDSPRASQATCHIRHIICLIILTMSFSQSSSAPTIPRYQSTYLMRSRYHEDSTSAIQRNNNGLGVKVTVKVKACAKK